MTLKQKQRFARVAMLLVLAALTWTWWPQPDAGFIVQEDHTVSTEPVYHEQFITFGETSATHAASITQRKDGKLIATWFAGSQEGAKDVTVSATTIDPDTHTISPSQVISTRLQTEKDTWRYIRKLGNPVIHTLPDGRLMLIYVSVSFGGWAASNLNIRFSENGGKTWSPAKRIVTSPAINISTLVRSKPVELDNGHIALPVYHEFLGKFGEILVLTADGDVVDKYRMSWGRDTIQPAVVPMTSTHALAFMRDSGETDKRIQFTQTRNRGYDWDDNQPLALPNPNASVAAIRLSKNELIQIFNNHEDERNILSLAYSADAGKNWKVIHDFENEPPQDDLKIKYSYPYIIRDAKDGFHLVYTWRKARIKYVRFNRAWLEQQL